LVSDAAPNTNNAGGESAANVGAEKKIRKAARPANTFFNFIDDPRYIQKYITSGCIAAIANGR
jgi:hypothetical protein